jgi:hypothetical protein
MVCVFLQSQFGTTKLILTPHLHVARSALLLDRCVERQLIRTRPTQRGQRSSVGLVEANNGSPDLRSSWQAIVLLSTLFLRPSTWGLVLSSEAFRTLDRTFSVVAGEGCLYLSSCCRLANKSSEEHAEKYGRASTSFVRAARRANKFFRRRKPKLLPPTNPYHRPA